MSEIIPNKFAETMRSHRVALLLLFVGIGMYLLTSYTPISHDDWRYAFIFPTLERIQSLGDIFTSQYAHFLTQNGRTIPHFLIQVFMALGCKTIFNVINAIVFCCFVYLLAMLTTVRKEDRFKAISLIVFLLFALVRGYSFSEYFLGITVSCNYLWPATFLLFFIYLYKKKLFVGNSALFGLFIMGVICGWTHEGIILPIAGALFIDQILNRKQLSKGQIALSLGLYIGALLIILSPGSHSRAEILNTTTNPLAHVKEYLVALFSIASYTSFLWIAVIVLLFFLIKSRKQFVELIKKNRIVLTALTLAFLFALFVKAFNNRTVFGTEFYALIFIVSVFFEYATFKNWVYIGLNVGSLLIFCYVISPVKQNYENYLEMVQQIENGKSNVILTKDVQANAFQSRFILPSLTYGSMRLYRGFDAKWNECTWVAAYFNRGELMFLPENLYSQLQEHPEEFKDFNTDSAFPVYLKLKQETDSITSAEYELKDVPIPFYFKPIASKMEWFTAKSVPVDSIYLIEIDHKQYYAIKNNNVNQKIRPERFNGIRWH